MYKEYFRLQREPFSITPDPRFLYMTTQHQEAINHLLYGIRQRKGFICLTGEVGAGKTTLCRALLAQIGEGFHTALILNPMLTGTQLLRAVLAEFGVQTKRQDRLGCLNELNKFLLSVAAAGQEAVLIIDEAQDMPLETLELTRLISNLETESHKLLQIVLVGQPELRARLAKPSLRQLAQRIAVRYHLGTLSREDTAQYIRHRLAVAGEGADGTAAQAAAEDALAGTLRTDAQAKGDALTGTRQAGTPQTGESSAVEVDADAIPISAEAAAASARAAQAEEYALTGTLQTDAHTKDDALTGTLRTVEFDEGAISEIFHQSRGTPRLINSLGDKALLAGYVYGTDHIDRRLVKLAAEEMKESLA